MTHRQNPGQPGGIKKWKQGALQITASFDVDSIVLQKKNATTTNSLYPTAGTGVFNIEDGEPLVENMNVPRSDVSSVPSVISALNGLGKEARNAYPNDEELQRLALKNSLQPRGFAVGKVSEGDHPIHALSSGIGGTSFPFLDEDIPTNSLVALDIPTSSEARAPYNSNGERGIHENKVLCKVVRHNPRMIQVEFSKHIRAILDDEKKYAVAFAPRDGGDVALVIAARALFTSQLTTIILGIDALQQQGIIGAGAGAVDIPRLAVGLGLVQNVPGSGVVITDADRDTYENLKKILLDKVNWSLNQQTMIGQVYGVDNVNSEGFVGTNGLINRKTIAGQLIELQHNHHLKAIQGLNLFVHDYNKWIVGKTLEGGTAGRRGNVLLYI